MTEKLKDFINSYEICDAHGHIFPDKIAVKAVSAIGKFYDIEMESDNGVSAAIISSGREIDVTHYLVCSTATTTHQVESINQFIADECKKHPEFIGFGTLHPDYDDIEGQVQFCIDNNLKGIKLHPDFQQFNIDDKKAFDIYEVTEGRLPILFHTGDDRYDYSSPERLKNVAESFPEQIMFAAHFGGYQRWEDSVRCLAGRENIFYDTSSSLPFMSTGYARKLISAFGDEKLFFGCDFPMWNHAEELERFMNLSLTDKQNSMILSQNFKKFFNI